MAAQPKQPTDKDRLKAGFYKGYDMRWLRNNPDHPEFRLVEEFDKLEKEKEE